LGKQSGGVETCVFYPEAPLPAIGEETLSLPYLPRAAVGDGELAQAVVIDAGVREGTLLQWVGPQQGLQAAAILRDQPFLLQGLIGVCKAGEKGKRKIRAGGWHAPRSRLRQPCSQASLPQRRRAKGFTDPRRCLPSSGAIWAWYRQEKTNPSAFTACRKRRREGFTWFDRREGEPRVLRGMSTTFLPPAARGVGVKLPSG